MARMYMGKKAVEAKTTATPQYNAEDYRPAPVEIPPAIPLPNFSDEKRFAALNAELKNVRESLFVMQQHAKIAIAALFILNILSFFI